LTVFFYALKQKIFDLQYREALSTWQACLAAYGQGRLQGLVAPKESHSLIFFLIGR